MLTLKLNLNVISAEVGIHVKLVLMRLVGTTKTINQLYLKLFLNAFL
jgi:hypothetical protein